MSRSEIESLAVLDEAVAAGVLAPPEADFWRTAVKDPCGCTEGLAVAGLVSTVSVVRRHGSLREAVVSATAGFAVGAVAGKVLGVATGLPLVRHQRSELRRRVAELRPPE